MAAARKVSPVSLVGVSLGELHKIPFVGEQRRERSLSGLRSSEEFKRTGRVPKSWSEHDHTEGVSVYIDGSGKSRRMFLSDGRHRFTVARELGKRTVWGTVRRVGSAKVLYRGPIPIGSGPTCRTIRGVSYELAKRPTPCRVGGSTAKPTRKLQTPARPDPRIIAEVMAASSAPSTPAAKQSKARRAKVAKAAPKTRKGKPLKAAAEPAPERTPDERDASWILSSGKILWEGKKTHQPARLAQFRRWVSHIPRKRFDRMMAKLSKDGRVRLTKIAKPTVEDRHAAVVVDGVPYHVAYVV